MNILKAVKSFLPGGASNVAPARKTSPGLTIKNMGDGVVAIYLYDDIGPDWLGMIGADTIRKELESNGDNIETIDLHINSRGGSIAEAMAIYNFLKDHKATVNSLIDGIAASSAGWVAMAGDTIKIAENGYIMLHDPTNVVGGDAGELRQAADVLDQMKNSVVQTYAKRTGIDAAEIDSMMTAETWIEGKDAVEKGFADELSPNKAENCALDFECFENVPDRAKTLAGQSNADDRPVTAADLRELRDHLKNDLKESGVESGLQGNAGISEDAKVDSRVSDAELADEMNALMV